MKKVFGVLLNAYPRTFRDRHEDELYAFFDDQRRDPRYRGGVGSFRFWWDVVFDLARSALLLRFRSRETSSQKQKGELTMGRDIRYAVRRLLHAKGFALAAVVTLALGIGASTAIFSVVHAVVISPLPYPDSDRLVSVWHAAPGASIPRLGFSLGSYVHYREHNRTFDGIAAYELAALNMTGDGDPERTNAAYVTASFFDLFQPPIHDRAITEQDDRPGAEDVLVMSHCLWQQRFGAQDNILGRKVVLDGASFRVVGVMPPRFDAPTAETELWLPRKLDPERVSLGGFSPVGIGLLKPGISVAEAQADLESLVPRFEERFPGRPFSVIVGQAGMTPRLTLLKEEVVGDVESMRFILLGTVGLVLLLACANVANLFIVRAEARRREVAIHTALGAGRSRVVRQFLTESLLLAGVGGAFGVALAYMAVDGLVALGLRNIPRLHEIAVNSTVLSFAAFASVLVGLAFGAIAVTRFSRVNLPASLKDGSRGSTAGRERYRSLLASFQVALALMLLVCAGLMVRSFLYLKSVDPGFDERRVLNFRISLPDLDYPSRGDTARFQQRLIERLSSVAGVEAVGATNCLPLTGCRSLDHVQREGMERSPDELPPPAHTRGVTDGYFEAMGMQLIEGRTIQRRDHEDRTGVVVVSQALAETWWPGESALGKGIYPGIEDSPSWYRIVGVVGDVPTNRLTGKREEIVYEPMIGRDESVHVPRSMSFAVKVSGHPEDWVPAVRSEVAALDPNLPIAEVRTLEALVADARAPTAFAMVLLGIAAVVALVLGAIGVYGVQSYMVSQRTGEIGVRMALGATAGHVSRMILRRGVTVAVAGVVIGWVGALGMTRWIESSLIGVPPRDIGTYAAVSLALVSVAIVASYLPARRASRRDPTVALRSE